MGKNWGDKCVGERERGEQEKEGMSDRERRGETEREREKR